MIRHVHQTLKDMERVQTLMLIGRNRSADALTSLLAEQIKAAIAATAGGG